MVVDVTHVITLHSDGLTQEYDFGYDIFDSIVQVRELQAKAMAKFMVEQNENEIVILGTGFKTKN